MGVSHQTFYLYTCFYTVKSVLTVRLLMILIFIIL
jgi:hypothetical protein